MNPQLIPPNFPIGYYCRAYAEINDLSLYTRLLNKCYSDLWGHHSSATVEAQAKWLEYYDPTGIFILFDPNGEALGIVRAQSAAQVNSQDGMTHSNSIDAPGLLPGHREPALYEALVHQALQWLANQTSELQTVTMLSWGDLDSTIDCYWRMGFIPVDHALGYRYYLK
jgi:hypothetical protein